MLLLLLLSLVVCGVDVVGVVVGGVASVLLVM
jgi:hypothetical protein